MKPILTQKNRKMLSSHPQLSNEMKNLKTRNKMIHNQKKNKIQKTIFADIKNYFPSKKKKLKPHDDVGTNRDLCKRSLSCQHLIVIDQLTLHLTVLQTKCLLH